MVAFWYFNKSEDTSSLLVADVKTTDSDEAKNIYSMQRKLVNVTLDDKLFINSVFLDLKDNHIDPVSQPVGRENPFAPVDEDSNVVER